MAASRRPVVLRYIKSNLSSMQKFGGIAGVPLQEAAPWDLLDEKILGARSVGECSETIQQIVLSIYEEPLNIFTICRGGGEEGGGWSCV